MQGHTLAALNVVGTGEQLTDAAVQHKWLPLLLEAARQLRPLL
jgi:IclR family pca regulon transcriptional regulator